MDKLFNPDSPFMKFCGKAADIFLLSILWLLFSIPIVTMGAATTAVYYVIYHLRNGESAVVKDFWKSFRQNFLQALVAEILSLVILVLILLDLRFLHLMNIGSNLVYWIMLLALVLGGCGWLSWVYPVLARFECSWKQLVKTPLFLAMLHIPTTILLLAISILFLAALLLFRGLALRLFPLVLITAPAGIPYLNTFFLNRVFAKHFPDHASVEIT